MKKPEARPAALVVAKLDAVECASRLTRRCVNDCVILDHDIVARSAIESVLPGAADQNVVAKPAEQSVVARTADEDVIAVAAVFGKQHAGQSCRGDDVVAADAIDHKAIVGARRR